MDPSALYRPGGDHSSFESVPRIRAVETFSLVSAEIRVLCFHTGLYGPGVGFSLSKGPSGAGFFRILKYPLLGLADLSDCRPAQNAS
jgi:hypothetical protein